MNILKNKPACLDWRCTDKEPGYCRENCALPLSIYRITTHRPTYTYPTKDVASDDLLQFRTASRHLRSSDYIVCFTIQEPVATVFGSRAFCHAAPTIWNSLPTDLTDNFNSILLSGFKCSLKTYFYSYYKLSFAT